MRTLKIPSEMWMVMIYECDTHKKLDEFGPYKSKAFAEGEGKALTISGKTYAVIGVRRL